MRTIVLVFCVVLSMGEIAGCATGGIVAGDGTATGGTVDVDVQTGNIEPCINLPSSVSGDCEGESE